MPRAFLFAIFFGLAFPAAAQQSAKPLPDCMVAPTSRENPVVANKCQQAIYVELFDVAQQIVVQGELKPSQAMRAPLEAFGAVCPAGYRSSVPLMLPNRPIFTQNMYACIRR
jgi:hypothetical protein